MFGLRDPLNKVCLMLKSELAMLYYQGRGVKNNIQKEHDW
ncbi:MAG: hypothetical protein Rpha_0539 [Candidatus Ruthia sp. Apha_13_S6]|nr:hypothetical protein [Candidatus Ruthia sp. Apha_13_S6]